MRIIAAYAVILVALTGCAQKPESEQASTGRTRTLTDETDNRSIIANALIAQKMKEGPAPGPGPAPEPNKVPRSQCPRPPEGCGGTGRVKSGDGIIWMDCDNCVDDSKADTPMEQVYGADWSKQAQLPNQYQTERGGYSSQPDEHDHDHAHTPSGEPIVVDAIYFKGNREIQIFCAPNQGRLPDTVSDIYKAKNGSLYFYLAKINTLPMDAQERIKLRLVEAKQGNYSAASAAQDEYVVAIRFMEKTKCASIVAVGPYDELLESMQWYKKQGN